jgi:hypothetical protein
MGKVLQFVKITQQNQIIPHPDRKTIKLSDILVNDQMAEEINQKISRLLKYKTKPTMVAPLK